MAIQIRKFKDEDKEEVIALIEKTIRNNWTEMNGVDLTEALIRGYSQRNRRTTF